MFELLKFMFDLINGITPKSVSNMLQPSNLIPQYNTRYSDLYHLPSSNYVKYGKHLVIQHGTSLWNELIKNAEFLWTGRNHNRLKRSNKSIIFLSLFLIIYISMICLFYLHPVTHCQDSLFTHCFSLLQKTFFINI